MIHVCYGLYDRDGHYSKFVGTSMLSIFENTTADVTVHILHDNTLTADNYGKFNYIAGRYGQQVKFYNLEINYAQNIEDIKKNMPSLLNSRYSIASMYRLFIPKLFDSTINKIIYFDADTIVNIDIEELWKI